MAIKDSYGATAASTASVRPTRAPTNVQVVAPATLEGGYAFDAMYDGTTFQVVVPEGGVVEGQRFVVPFNPPVAVAVAVPAGGGVGGDVEGGGGWHSRGGGIPTGVWRDGLCDCFRFGLFHPHFLNSLFFRPCLIGQVLTRMKMTWIGQQTSGVEGGEWWRDTFRNIVAITAVYYVIMTMTSATEPDSSGASLLFGAYLIYVTAQLRAAMRRAYSIPEESCLCLYCGEDPRGGICGGGAEGLPVGWEDVCCAMWCQLCTAAQMARHTVDYGEKDAVCCNTVGVAGWDDEEAYKGLEGVGEGSVLVV